MQIESERLHMRRVLADDWQSIGGIWKDFGGSEYAQYDRPHDTDDADVRQRIATWAKYSESSAHMFFAVCLQDAVIGYIAFNAREIGYEIGYCFHSAYHGKGYARESLAALIEYMRAVGVKRFTAGTALNNTPSVRLLDSLNFHLAGREKVSFYKDSEGNDIVFDGGIFELML